MSTEAKIDGLAERAKRLSADRQQEIVEALREMIDEPYQLSQDELAVLEPALADAQAARNVVSLADVDKRMRELIETWPK